MAASLSVACAVNTVLPLRLSGDSAILSSTTLWDELGDIHYYVGIVDTLADNLFRDR